MRKNNRSVIEKKYIQKKLQKLCPLKKEIKKYIKDCQLITIIQKLLLLGNKQIVNKKRHILNCEYILRHLSFLSNNLKFHIALLSKTFSGTDSHSRQKIDTLIIQPRNIDDS